MSKFRAELEIEKQPFRQMRNELTKRMAPVPGPYAAGNGLF